MSSYPILDIGLPSNGHSSEVKEFNVAIIITRSHTPVMWVVGVACKESNVT